jgi:hypothetical protein
LGRIAKPRLYVVVAQDPVDFRHIECAVADSHALGHVQSLADHERFIALFALGWDGVNFAASLIADKERAAGTQGHRPCSGHLGIEADFKARRQAKVAQRIFLGAAQ